MSRRATVHNIRREAMRPDDIRIDRQTEHGNPYVIGVHGDRETCIRRCEERIEARIASDPSYREKVRAMHGRRLFCWCAPQPCHGHVFACIASRLAAEDENPA